MRLNYWTSLQRRLPLSVSLLIFGVVAGLTWFGYLEQRALLLRNAETHLDEVASQLSTALEQSARLALRNAQALAGSSVVDELLENPAGHESRERARDTLHKSILARAQVTALEVRASGGERVLVVARTIADSQRVADRTLSSGDLRPGVGSFTGQDTLVHYAVTTAIGDSAHPRGWLVTYARATNGESAQMLARLIGQDAAFLVGSASNGVWTNLVTVVEAPTASNRTGAFADYRWQGGQRWRGVQHRLAGTPWELWVAQPYTSIVTPARGFTGRMLLLGVIVLAIGWGVAIVLSRRLTQPITQLTAAAEKLSNGEYPERVPVRGTDEIADLGRSFNRMADRIEASTHELEDRVIARTAELKRALSELEAAQDQLVRKERLAILGQLASGVGHELRNPLGVMLNATYYLNYVLKDASQDVHEYIGILQGQIGLAEKIVSDLLEFSRIKPPQREEVDLARLMEEQIARLGPVENIEIIRDYDEAAPVALVDRVQIGQVVFNLLTNAVQAMTSGGRLTVRTYTHEGEACIDVGDTAGGVAQENLERIFEPLFTTKARGIGLGLSVSRSLAHANDGELTVRNDGDGAVFSLMLPGVPALVSR